MVVSGSRFGLAETRVAGPREDMTGSLGAQASARAEQRKFLAVLGRFRYKSANLLAIVATDGRRQSSTVEVPFSEKEYPPMNLPFPELPYGAAPAWCFPLVELSIYILFAACFLSAWKRGTRALTYLLGGLAFGLLLEYFEVVTDSYTYGHFWVMLGRAPHDLPLWVGCAWAIIMYTARRFSDVAGLPLFGAAALDTLLALNIDIGIDAVAYRLHMWHWDWTGTHLNPLTADWFGIPYGNFVGWITVVLCYSAFSRILERWVLRRSETMLRLIAVAGGAITCSLGVLVFTELAVFPVLNHLGVRSGWRLTLATAALLVLAVWGWSRRSAGESSSDPLAHLVPAWFHVLFVTFLFALGFYRENPWLIAAAIVNFALGLSVHMLLKKPSLETGPAPATAWGGEVQQSE